MFTDSQIEKRNDFAIENSNEDVAVSAASERVAPTTTVEALEPTSSNVFDYAKIPTDKVRQQAQDAATRIRENMAKTKATYVAIGRDLLSIKAQLAHGEFSSWIAVEFEMTIRTAQNMMNAAELVDKYTAVSILPPTVLYKLAAKSTPDGVRTKIAKQIQDGVIPQAKDIDTQIARGKEAAQEQREIELKRKAAEHAAHLDALSWKKHEKHLRSSNISDADIAKEQKKWTNATARKERNKQRRLEEQQKLMVKAKLNYLKNEDDAIIAVKFLHEKLGEHFDDFRKIMENVKHISLFERALKVL